MILEIKLSIPDDTARRIRSELEKNDAREKKISELKRLWSEMTDASFDESNFVPKLSEIDRLIDTEIFTAEYRTLLNKQITAFISDSENEKKAESRPDAEAKTVNANGAPVPVKLKKKRGRPERDGASGANDIKDAKERKGIHIIFDENSFGTNLMTRIMLNLPEFVTKIDQLSELDIAEITADGGYLDRISDNLNDNGLYTRVSKIILDLIDELHAMRAGMKDDDYAKTTIARSKGFNSGLGIEVLTILKRIEKHRGERGYNLIKRNEMLTEKMLKLEGMNPDYGVCSKILNEIENVNDSTEKGAGANGPAPALEVIGPEAG